MEKLKCPYCNNDAVIVGGVEIYPHRKDLESRMFYICKPCNAYVGTHKGTIKPLGMMANNELRKARNEAHKYFDQLWKLGVFKRKEAYQWLASKLKINESECHIGMFDINMCKKAKEICIGEKINGKQ